MFYCLFQIPAHPTYTTLPTVSNGNSSYLVTHLEDLKISKDTVTKAEILWCLQTVMNHNFFRSAESDAFLFKKMFSVSKIAQNI